jgi:predicted transcriptional regulator
MRTLVDLSPDELDRLAEIARRRRVSRAAVMREALQDYIARQPRNERDAAFGAWSTGEDGLAYQERMREEW